MSMARPVLAQFASTAAASATLPNGSAINPRDSMLRMPGAPHPLVETLLALQEPASGLSTILTEAHTDPDDPDLIRSSHQGVSTLITRTNDETSDPDLIRFHRESTFSTIMTKSNEDPYDPDTVRMTLDRAYFHS